MKTGDIYFNRPEYKQAYLAYDSALVYLPETDALSDSLTEKHASLQVLVRNLEVVEREDNPSGPCPNARSRPHGSH